MHRRDFFNTSIQAFLGAMALSSCRSHVPYQPIAGTKGHVILGINSRKPGCVVRILSLDDYTYRDYHVPVEEAHAVSKSQWDKNKIYVFGTAATSAIVDLNDGSCVTRVNSEGMIFNGHGAQVVEDNIMWCSENNSTGQIFLRARTSDLNLIEGSEYTIEGGHHVMKIPESNLLVTGGVTSKGKLIRIFDHATRKVIHDYSIDYTPVHFLKLSSTEYIAVTASSKQFAEDGLLVRLNFRVYGDLSNPAPVIWFNTKGDYKYIWKDEDKEQMRLGFSATKLSSDLFVTGHLKSGTVNFWKNMQLVKTLNVGMPVSLAPSKDGTQLIVHSGEVLKVYSLSDYKLEKTIRYEDSILSMSGY